jgi:hypothetical protein
MSTRQYARLIRFEKERPMSNLLLSILHQDKIGDSTDRLRLS